MKLNKNQNYFKKLQQYFTKAIYDKYDDKISIIAKQQKKTKEAVMKQIGKVLLLYTIENNFIKINNKDKIILKNEFENLINQVFVQEINSETDICSKMHFDVAVDKYYSTSYIYSLDSTKAIKPLHDNVLKKIINIKIDGKTFSDRIWGNKNKVAKQIKVEVKKFLNGETDVNAISRIIQKRFDANKYNSTRLIKDSIGRVQEAANEVWRKEHDIDYVLWDATLDMRTCERCADRDGKVYENNKAPNCPAHVLCRCSLDSIVDKDWRPREKWDNENKNRIDWQSYEKWKKNNIEKSEGNAIIEETRKRIQSGEQKLTIEEGKQGKHIIGHKNYIQGRSYLTISMEEAQELVNKYAGTGELLFSSAGKWKNQEIIKTDKVIGYNVSDIDNSKTETKNFKIHYSKKGTHIVPK